MKQEDLQELCAEILADIKKEEAQINELKALRPHLNFELGSQYLDSSEVHEMEKELRFTKSIALLASALIASQGEHKDK